MVGTTVRLTDEQIAFIQADADERQRVNDCNGVKDRRYSKMTSLEVHRLGRAGEVVAAQVLGAKLDMTNSSRSKAFGTDSGEIILPCGDRVDVKTTDYGPGALMVPSDRTPPSAKWLALVTGKWPNPWVFRGCAKTASVLQENRILFPERSERVRVPTYVMEQSELHMLTDEERLGKVGPSPSEDEKKQLSLFSDDDLAAAAKKYRIRHGPTRWEEE